MKRRHLLLFFLPMLLALSTPAMGEPQALSGAEPVDLTADELSYDRLNETMHAQGGVRLKKGDLTLLADQVFWHPDNGDADAAGNVRLDSPEGIIQSEKMHLNMESGLGRMNDARILLREGNYHIAGEEIERLGEDRYRIVDGTFTTCDGEPPSWKFSARRMDVTVGGYARARHVFFYLHDLPVLYIPFIAYPVKTERESGFLMPRVGSSNKRGTQLSLAWYQVIDRHLDATFYLDYLSKLGLGKGLEYRYIFGEQAEGTAEIYHVSGIGEAEDRYAVDWQHAGALPGNVRLIADVEYVSSRDYFEDFGEVAGEYNQDQVQSVITATRNWRLTSLSGLLKYTKDLENDNDLTLQRLPEVVFTALPHRLGETPFFLSLDSAYTHFWRREGMTGDRFTLRPELSAVFQPGEYLEIRPAAGYRERFYWTSEEGPGYEEEGIADFSTRISSRFSRVYLLDGENARKLRHSIEPELTYRYVPHEDQTHLPQFDSLDTLVAENSVAYALVNRLVARQDGAGGEPYYHEYAYLRLSQSYDFREANRDTPLGEEDRPFSPLRTELIVRPNRFSYLDLDLRYDVNSGVDSADRLTSISARAGVHDDAGNSLSLDYQHQDETLEALSYLGGTVALAWLKPVYLNYQHRQDLDAGKVLEQVLNVEYRAQCWSVFLTLRDRLEDTEYLISFALTGLGRVTELGGSIGGAGE
jgi:LPS-assembly protein